LFITGYDDFQQILGLCSVGFVSAHRGAAARFAEGVFFGRNGPPRRPSDDLSFFSLLKTLLTWRRNFPASLGHQCKRLLDRMAICVGDDSVLRRITERSQPKAGPVRNLGVDVPGWTKGGTRSNGIQALKNWLSIGFKRQQ
jgi:hypothetical protein